MRDLAHGTRRRALFSDVRDRAGSGRERAFARGVVERGDRDVRDAKLNDPLSFLHHGTAPAPGDIYERNWRTRWSNISDMRKAALVIKDGIVYRPAELYEALGIRPQ